MSEWSAMLPVNTSPSPALCRCLGRWRLCTAASGFGSIRNIARFANSPLEVRLCFMITIGQVGRIYSGVDTWERLAVIVVFALPVWLLLRLG